MRQFVLFGSIFYQFFSDPLFLFEWTQLSDCFPVLPLWEGSAGRKTDRHFSALRPAVLHDGAQKSYPTVKLSITHVFCITNGANLFSSFSPFVVFYFTFTAFIILNYSNRVCVVIHISRKWMLHSSASDIKFPNSFFIVASHIVCSN